MAVKGIGSVSQPQLQPVSNTPEKAPAAPAPRPAPARDSYEPSQARGVALGHGAAPSDSGKGLNGTAGTLRSSSGRISADAWSHPEQIVGHLTQNPASGALGNSGVRCGPSALLGAALMQGQANTARFLDAAATGSTRLSAAQRSELQGIAGDVRAGRASFQQLSRAQDLLYRAGNSHGDIDALMTRAIGSMPAGADRTRLTQLQTQLASPQGWLPQDAAEAQRILHHAGHPVSVGLIDDPQHPGDASRQYYAFAPAGREVATDVSGFDDAELNGLATTGGATTRQVPLTSAARMEDLFNQLQRGETMTIRVGGTADSDVSDHFISIGRRTDGTAFIYNPDPGNGDYTLFTGNTGATQPAAFTEQLTRYNERLLLDTDNDMPNATVSRFPPN